MKAASVKPVRCAIYTRVSTEHGLDQEFNSLDAQYDAASAYIKSQAHAGWTLIRSRYDDGGYSGGSTDRPAPAQIRRRTRSIRFHRRPIAFNSMAEATLQETSSDPAPAHDAMQKNYRSGRFSTKTSIEDEIAHLRGLDLGGLRARWQSVFQRQAPAHLTRHLLIAVIAYRLQVDRFGDLDHATKEVLDRAIAKEPGSGMSARLASLDQKRTGLTPGTMLVREWDRQSQRVMVMADGFAWNGQTYDRLSKVAFAITGTRWNGPRFFGLRDKDKDGRLTTATRS